jgi:hypothetical protein
MKNCFALGNFDTYLPQVSCRASSGFTSNSNDIPKRKRGRSRKINDKNPIQQDPIQQVVFYDPTNPRDDSHSHKERHEDVQDPNQETPAEPTVGMPELVPGSISSFTHLEDLVESEVELNDEPLVEVFEGIDPALDQFPDVLRSLVYQKNKQMIHQTKRVASAEDAMDWVEKGFHFGIRLDQLKLIVVDIDDRELGLWVVSRVSATSTPFAATLTPRGVHLFFTKGDQITDSVKGHGKFVTLCGIQIEIRTKTVTFLGSGYPILSSFIDPHPFYTFLENLSGPLPWFLNPIQIPRGGRIKIDPLFPPEGLPIFLEGVRNFSLFGWGSFLKRLHAKEHIKSLPMKELMYFMGFQMCNPPLPAAELETILKSIAQVEVEKTLGKNLLSSADVVDHLLEIWTDLIYDARSLVWRQWNGKFWETVSHDDLCSKILHEIRQLDRSALRMNLITDILALLCLELRTPFSPPTPGLINFQNGVLEISTGNLVEHSMDYHFTHIVSVDYEAAAYPDEMLQSLLRFFVDNNTVALNMLRGMFRRILQPCPDLQTGFWIYGGSGTGKSSIQAFIREIIKDSTVDFSCQKYSSFNRPRLKDAVCVSVDSNYISRDAAKLLHNILGRDSISYDVKSRQVNASCVCDAVVVVTANTDLTGACPGFFDIGLRDRFIEIEFDNAPTEPVAGISRYLVSQTPAIVNWALEVDIAVLKSQVRVGFNLGEGLVKEGLVEFIQYNLTEDPKGFIPNRNLVDMFDEYCRISGLSPVAPSYRASVKFYIRSTLKKYFGIITEEGRKAETRGLKGIRKQDATVDPPLQLLESPSFGSLTKIDPFARNRVVDYNELERFM